MHTRLTASTPAENRQRTLQAVLNFGQGCSARRVRAAAGGLRRNKISSTLPLTWKASCPSAAWHRPNAQQAAISFTLSRPAVANMEDFL